MATVKKNGYVDKELDWLERKYQELQQYIDDRPFTSLDDRKGFRPTAKGGMIEYVIASIEQQRQDLTKALIEAAQLLDAIKKLRMEEEKEKLKVRGDDELSPMESGEI